MSLLRFRPEVRQETWCGLKDETWLYLGQNLGQIHNSPLKTVPRLEVSRTENPRVGGSSPPPGTPRMC